MARESLIVFVDKRRNHEAELFNTSRNLAKLLATVGPGVFGRRFEVRDRDEFQNGRELSLRREQLMIDL